MIILLSVINNEPPTLLLRIQLQMNPLLKNPVQMNNSLQLNYQLLKKTAETITDEQLPTQFVKKILIISEPVYVNRSSHTSSAWLN